MGRRQVDAVETGRDLAQLGNKELAPPRNTVGYR
jgi:hypothetical protein